MWCGGDGAECDNADVDNMSTPLHEAARLGQCKLVLVLIEQGASVNVQDRYGHTPLYYAYNNGHMSAVDVLFANGAVFNIHSGRRRG